jgi:hypothetical protein
MNERANDLKRGALPGGSCIAIRLQDGSAGGRGALVGYAFVPAPSGLKPAMQSLMAAILAAEDALDPARAA